ncbi:MAG: hypothetical protein IPJ81_05465 [Chitinophagaceae bacterium]|nr:hypothetical protein [Chitinophagaceae bacterium]
MKPNLLKTFKGTMAIAGVMLAGINTASAQVGIGTKTPDQSAMLDVFANNKGLLVPRVALVSVTDAVTIPTPATSLFVYNTNPNITGAVGVGFYYNSGTPAVPRWSRLSPDGTAWVIGGNKGTNPVNHFIGTTDNADVVMKRGGQEVMRFYSGGHMIATGEVANAPVPVNGSGTRMMYLPAGKGGAFRVGTVNGTQWSEALIGISSFASGSSTTASGAYSFATGGSTTAEGLGSFAAGTNSKASGAASVAMGTSAIADKGGVAIGENVKATGIAATAFGSNTTASGGHSTALGQNTTASGEQSIAIGFGAIASANNSISFGFNTSALGPQAMAFGNATGAGGTNSASFGFNTKSLGAQAVSFGSGSEAHGDNSIAMGQSASFGNNSFAGGNNSSTSGTGIASIAFGNNAAAQGSGSAAFGSSTIASAAASISLGDNTAATGNASFAAGEGTLSRIRSSAVVGRYNIDSIVASPIVTGGNTKAFVVGNGTNADNRSDAFFVRYNGNTTVSGSLTVGGTTGTPINSIIKVNPIINFAAMGPAGNDGAVSISTIPVANVKMGATVLFSPTEAAGLPNGVVVAWARVNADGFVQIALTNTSNIPRDPINLEYSITIFQ